MDPNIDDNAAVLPPSNYDGTAESYAQDSFAMDVDTDSSASHEDSSDTDSSIPDIESDYGSDTEPFGAAFGMDLEEWKSFDEDGDHDVPLTRDEMIAELEEMLGPDEEGKLWERRNEILSDQDHDNIRAFRLRLLCNIPHVAFAQMRHAFRHKLDISSHWVMILLR
ncbi:hypothetical protein C8R46DRAFT_1210212 [Mycena filopes]|nr:hypothetical protein C8R46DRAFT_1210212 [Mycena filopes]